MGLNIVYSGNIDQTHQSRAAHVKTTSKKNLTIERIWPEVNARQNYPIKRILIAMEESGALDMTNEKVQYCVSWFSCEVAKVGMMRFVAAWNLHKIKGMFIYHLSSMLDEDLKELFLYKFTSVQFSWFLSLALSSNVLTAQSVLCLVFSGILA